MMNSFQRHVTHSPWSALQEIANSLNSDLARTRGRGTPSAYQGTRGVFPPVNLAETEKGFVLSAELPGVAPDAIDVSIEGSTVTLAGQRKVEYAAGEGVSVHRRERQSGNFRRAFELPVEIDVDRAKARHKNGVLTLELPKSASVEPRQIAIETS